MTKGIFKIKISIGSEKIILLTIGNLIYALIFKIGNRLIKSNFIDKYLTVSQVFNYLHFILFIYVIVINISNLINFFL